MSISSQFILFVSVFVVFSQLNELWMFLDVTLHTIRSFLDGMIPAMSIVNRYGISVSQMKADTWVESVCRYHNPVLSSFMTYQQVL